jgi:hypothetical protein
MEKWTVSGQQERSCCPLTSLRAIFFCLIGQKQAAVPNEEKPGLFYLRRVFQTRVLNDFYVRHKL